MKKRFMRSLAGSFVATIVAFAAGEALATCDSNAIGEVTFNGGLFKLSNGICWVEATTAVGTVTTTVDECYVDTAADRTTAVRGISTPGPLAATPFQASLPDTSEFGDVCVSGHIQYTNGATEECPLRCFALIDLVHS